MSRNLGGLGEVTLQKWALEEGLILNKVGHDASGWDFVLEWPSGDLRGKEDLRLPLDKTKAPFQCLVQVKASDSERPRPQVKLDNWIRFIKSPLPTFFLLLSFQGGKECIAAYLVPVWEDQIRQVLERLRKLSATEAMHEVDLRKRSSVVSWTEAHRLPSPDGRSLALAVENHVGAGIESYSKRKLELIRKVGYEHGEAAVDVRFTIPEGINPNEYLVDFALGLVPELNVVGGHAFDVRFGIRSHPPTLTFEPGTTLRIGNEEALPARLTASLEDTDRTVAVELEAVFPKGVGKVISKEYLKILLRRPFMKIQMRPYADQKINYNLSLPELDKEHALADARPVADLITLWTDAAAKAAPMGLEIQIDGKSLGNSRLDPPPPLGDGFKKWADMVRHAWVVARHFEVESSMVVTLDELIRSADALQLMSYVLQPSGGVFRVEYSLAHADAEVAPHCLPLVAEAIMGRSTFQIGAVLIGVPEAIAEGPDGRRYLLQGRDVRLHKADRFPERTSPSQSVADIRDELVHRYDDKMTVLLFPE